MDKNSLLNSVFFPRPSFIPKNEKDHLVSVEDEIKVGVRFFLKDKKYPNIIFFHGNAELAQEYDNIGKLYNQYNCNFIVSDYRGYGLSDGKPTKDNLHLDANIIFSYVKSMINNNNYSGKTIVMGRSLGSASACEIISTYANNIDGCIIESGFATEKPILEMFNINPSEIDFQENDGFGNLKKLRFYSKPLLIIHAEKDHIIPINEAEFMHKESTSNKKELWVIPNANHNDIMMHTKENYFIKIRNFINSI
tara:strand:+ start:158 stop:910 length:753 start_codon:yes stop_codon:yes gene_type:complete